MYDFLEAPTQFIFWVKKFTKLKLILMNMDQKKYNAKKINDKQILIHTIKNINFIDIIDNSDYII